MSSEVSQSQQTASAWAYIDAYRAEHGINVHDWGMDNFEWGKPCAPNPFIEARLARKRGRSALPPPYVQEMVAERKITSDFNSLRSRLGR